MKTLAGFSIAALGLAGALATAQTLPSADAPEPVQIETMVDLTGPPGPPEDLHAVREEAVNALHWAKTEGCRSDPSPRDCVRRAQDEYNATMARLGLRR